MPFGIMFIITVFSCDLFSYDEKWWCYFQQCRRNLFFKRIRIFNEEFDLKISSIGGTIFYTLDGSIPTCNSIKYDGPIHILDASENDNVYSNKVDISQIYIINALNDFVMGDLSDIIPQYKIDKCTVIRAFLSIVYVNSLWYNK